MKFAALFTIAIIGTAVFTAAFIPTKTPAGGDPKAATVVHQNGIAY